MPRSSRESGLLSRNYDVVLFGQALFDNLDSYPYWHSSQIQERGGEAKNMKLDAFNLAQYASFEADSQLERIRGTTVAASRAKALRELNEQLKKDIPGMALHSPLYIYAHDESVRGIKLGTLALHADRFAFADQWYIATKRQFIPGKNWWSLPVWFLRLVYHS